MAAGVAIGISSHAAGTSRAIELGEIQGAMSSILIGVSGLITVAISLFSDGEERQIERLFLLRNSGDFL